MVKVRRLRWIVFYYYYCLFIYLLLFFFFTYELVVWMLLWLLVPLGRIIIWMLICTTALAAEVCTITIQMNQLPSFIAPLTLSTRPGLFPSPSPVSFPPLSTFLPSFLLLLLFVVRFLYGLVGPETILEYIFFKNIFLFVLSVCLYPSNRVETETGVLLFPRLLCFAFLMITKRIHLFAPIELRTLAWFV